MKTPEEMRNLVDEEFKDGKHKYLYHAFDALSKKLNIPISTIEGLYYRKDNIRKQAKEDFDRILNNPKNNIYPDDVFKNNMRELFLRHKEGQYNTDYFVHQMEIYWRCIIEYFRKEFEKLKKK